MAAKRTIRTSDVRLKFARLISENSKGGIIHKPSRFWEEAGYKNQKTATAVVSNFCKNELLEHFKKNTYRICFFLSATSDVIVSTKKEPKKPEIREAPSLERLPFLILAPKEKEVFDALDEAASLAGNRLRETDLDQLGEEGKERFFEKMTRFAVLQPVGKGKRGRIFHLDIGKYRKFSDHVRVMADIVKLYDDFSAQWELVDVVLQTLGKNKEHLQKVLKGETGESRSFQNLLEIIDGLQKSQKETQAKAAFLKILIDLSDKGKVEILDLLEYSRA
jgi:hypothetical protein